MKASKMPDTSYVGYASLILANNAYIACGKTALNVYRSTGKIKEAASSLKNEFYRESKCLNPK